MIDRHADASTLIDRAELEQQVQDVYRGVARDPLAPRHFETGRNLALRHRALDACRTYGVESLTIAATREGDNA